MIEGMSFQEVAEKYAPLIRSQIKKLHIYRDWDEFFQIGLIGLWKAYEQYDKEKGRFATIAMFRIRGSLLDHLRKEGLFQKHHLYGEDVLLHYMEDENCLIKEMLEQQLDEYSSFLSEREAQWLQYAIIQDKKPAQIAKELGVSTNTVGTWRKKALKKLRAAIENGQLVLTE